MCLRCGGGKAALFEPERIDEATEEPAESVVKFFARGREIGS